MKPRFYIKDWAGNIMFDGKTFKTFEDANDFLTEQIEKEYPDTVENDERFSEERDEFEIVEGI